MKIDRSLVLLLAFTAVVFSWRDTYDCDLRINGDRAFAEGNFKWKLLSSPNASGPEAIGWVWTITKINYPVDKFARWATKLGNNNYAIPFRFFNPGTGSYTNPFLGRKWISFQLTNDFNESLELRVVLPYKIIGWIINDDEATKVKNWVANLARVNKALVKNEKILAVKSGNTLVDQKNLLAAASGNQAAFQNLSLIDKLKLIL